MKEKIIASILISFLLIAGVAIANTGAAARGPPNQGPPGDDIVEVVVAANAEGGPYEGQFDVLIAAVTATPEVAEILSGNGQHTVFGPTDAAFESLADKLGFEELEDLIAFLLDNPDYLKDVLVYHIAHGRLYAEDVLEKDQINTLRRGWDGFLMQDGGVLTDNLGREANIIVTDVEAANGIIHAIDNVVLPYLPEE
ncbi:MAG: fasciclin domain-containing protein [Thermoplasmata archaeon]